LPLGLHPTSYLICFSHSSSSPSAKPHLSASPFQSDGLTGGFIVVPSRSSDFVVNTDGRLCLHRASDHHQDPICITRHPPQASSAAVSKTKIKLIQSTGKAVR
jgi:hypothetical protein